MRTLMKSLLGATLVMALVASAVSAGPIRDLIRNRLAARQGGEAAAGLQRFSINYQGLDRSYYLHVPASVAGKAGAPLVFVFHGGQGDGTDAAKASQMAVVADELGFIAVFPDSYQHQWNDGRATTQSNVDDVGFVKTLIATLGDSYGADTSRVFAAGISNGGIFTQRLACDASKSFRAFAVVAANFPADYQGSCAPSRPVPMIFFNGTTDGLMPWAGGTVKSSKLLGMGAGGQVLSHDQTRAFWMAVDGCGGSGRVANLPDSTNDGTTVTVVDYAQCSAGTRLSFFEIAGGGHNWPGSGTRSSRIAGQVSQDVSATSEMVAFFSRYGL